MKNMICFWNIGNNGNTALTNEDYKKTVQSRIRLMIVIFLAGAMLLILGTSNEYFGFFPGSYRQSIMNGIVTGMGSAMAIVGLVKVIRYKKLLKDEDALREDRLRRTDERNKYIAQNALMAATVVVIVFAYVAMIAGGVAGYMQIFYSMFVIIILFFAYYLLFTFLLHKKM